VPGDIAMDVSMLEVNICRLDRDINREKWLFHKEM
jgi:hypothetical protein